MPEQSSTQAILILEDGNIFYGKAFGKCGTTTGEICFNTGMTGYQEVFTDPSYYGQVVIMNSVHVGNYGTHEKEVESDSVKVKGIIGRNLEMQYSRFASSESMQEYFERQNIVAIDGILSVSNVTSPFVRKRRIGAIRRVRSAKEMSFTALHCVW